MAMPASRYLFGTFPWYSFLMVTGIAVALFLAVREEKRLSLPKDTVIDLALLVIPFGIIGGRLYYVFFSWEMFQDDLLSILYVWQGGMAIYGAVIGGFIAIVLFCLRRKTSILTLCDALAPGLILAQAIGRWGNYFNMEAYGLAVTDPAWQFFPFAVLIPGAAGNTWHMATFFYESMWNLCTFAVLMLGRRHMHRRGDVFYWYMLLYGGGRLIIEGLRLDSLMAASGSVRISQLLSVCMCMAVVLRFAYPMLRQAGKKQLLIGLSASLLTLGAAVLLPMPAEAFTGYNAVWVLQAALFFGLAVMMMLSCASLRRKLLMLLPVALVIVSAVVRTMLAGAGISGFESSTLLCVLYTACCITCGAAVYLPLNTDTAVTAD